jgi:hypothetical protein
MVMETLPLWVQVLALFGVPALGVYSGLKVGLAEMKGEHEKLKELTNLRFVQAQEDLERQERDVRDMRRRVHAHAHAISRLSMKVHLQGVDMGEEDDDNG